MNSFFMLWMQVDCLWQNSIQIFLKPHNLWDKTQVKNNGLNYSLAFCPFLSKLFYTRVFCRWQYNNLALSWTYLIKDRIQRNKQNFFFFQWIETVYFSNFAYWITIMYILTMYILTMKWNGFLHLISFSATGQCANAFTV